MSSNNATQIPKQAREWFLPKLEGIHCLQARTVEVPKPQPGQVLVKIHTVSLNYRDIIISRNQYAGDVADNIIPCSDAAGEVVSVGAGVSKWKVGDRVCANFALDFIAGETSPAIQDTVQGSSVQGVLMEYKVFPHYSLVKIPDHLSYEEAATLPCAAVTAWNALHGPAPVKAGDFVLVQGTGGVAIFALQFAVASGATVIATSSSDTKLAKAKELGATHLINYAKTPDWDQEVLKLTNGAGVHHIIEVGGPATIDKSLNCVRMGGYIHVIGFLDMKAEGDATLPLKVLFKAVHVRGILVGSVSQFEDLNRALAVHQIHPIVDSVFELDDLQAAFDHLESQKHIGKVVVRVAKSN